LAKRKLVKKAARKMLVKLTQKVSVSPTFSKHIFLYKNFLISFYVLMVVLVGYFLVKGNWSKKAARKMFVKSFNSILEQPAQDVQ